MNRVAWCSINWIWLANKTLLSVLKGITPGSGASSSTPWFHVFCNAHIGWNSYFSNVNFPLQCCHLKMSLREDSEGREDISGIISCSVRRCLSDLVHDMPPCFSVSCSRSFQTPVCLNVWLPVCASRPYLFPSFSFCLLLYCTLTTRSWQQKRVCCMYIFSH